jgi:hypothetical protein
LAGYSYTDLRTIYKEDENGNLVLDTSDEAAAEIEAREERLEKDASLKGYFVTIGE